MLAHSTKRNRVDRLYRSGETVSAGMYVCLEDGRFVKVVGKNALPSIGPLPVCYMRVPSTVRTIHVTSPLSFPTDTAIGEAA